MSETESSSTNRQFWQLQLAGWAAYSAYGYLLSLAHGKPAGYWTVVLAAAVAGFAATSALRYVLRALSHLPAVLFFVAALGPVLVATGIMGVGQVTALAYWCGEECRPHSVL
ncbi:MAG TPA: hypothetical protein VND91_00745, partial [Candidatus Saccharimonadia bacterium]|nr:hypothetical protein [Candidatus Saccharimonadia bacterium]